MATDYRKFTALGMVPALAKAVAQAIDAAATPANITGFNAAVEDAVAAKTEIAALSGGSTAANIVTALKA